MTLSPNLPPNIEDIKVALPDIVHDNMVYTYGDTVYNCKLDPDGKPIPLAPHLEVHERVHIAQQTAGPKAWWDQWLSDPAFRLEQEVEAYAKQYAFIRGFAPTDQAAWFLFQIASSLANDYGLELDHAQAESKIRNKQKTAL